MAEFVMYDKDLFQVKFGIFKRKIKKFFLTIFLILIKPFKIIVSLTPKILCGIYYKLYCHRNFLWKQYKKLTMFYCIIASTILIGFFIYYRFTNPKKILLSKSVLYSIFIAILIYNIIRWIAKIYHYFFGEYIVKEEEYRATIEYVCSDTDRLKKVFGGTGKGKDTFVAGCSSILTRYFREKTINDIERIKDICYIFDFSLIDADLDQYQEDKDLLSFSKEKLKNFWIGSEKEPGLAIRRNFYIKKYYNKLSANSLLQDYYSFIENPMNYESKYVYGTGINKTHFVDLLMYEYAEWWLRENVERHYLMSNQPFIEDMDTGLPALEFSFNFLRTKTSTKIITENGKKKKIIENVFFPWKDRLVVIETECGTWYSNRDNEGISELMSAGIRDFKAYQRHFMDDFYWFQVDQAPGRTALLFRELEHSYVCVLNREKILGGKKKNQWLSLVMNYYIKKLNKISYKREKIQGNIRRITLMEDYKQLYMSSSKEKYYNKYKNIEKSLITPYKLKKFEKYRQKIAKLRTDIKSNEADGFIVVTVCISKTGVNPTENQIQALSSILQMKNRPTTFTTQFVFRISDCERYDTRYLRQLAEKKANESRIVLANCREWDACMKLKEDDIKWMGYTQAKNMYGIPDEEIEAIRYGDDFKKYMKK